MAPCLEALLNTAPLAKAPERKNEGEISAWAHAGLQHWANTKANPHLSMRIPTSMCAGCVYNCTCVLCRGMRNMCALMCLCAPRKSLPKAQLPSFWRMVPFHLIYLSRKWTTHFSFFFPWCLWHHPSFTSLPLFQFALLFFHSPRSLSHNFFQSCCLTLPSSLKLCRGHNLEPQPFLLECH